MSWASFIIDANLNRAREGLRVLEELARFVLRDDALWKCIKAMRHKLRVVIPIRNVVMPAEAGIQSGSLRWNDILNANACRVQEALRVLEEYSGDKVLYGRLRFETYDIHQCLFLALRQMSLKGAYIIVDPNAYNVSPEQVANAVRERNSHIVQLRDKNATKQEILARARSIRAHLPPNILLIVNDHLDVALAVADGVHLGQTDFPVNEAVRISPAHFIIGASVKNTSQAKAEQDAGASYVAMGAVFPTRTKLDASSIELEEITKARAVLQIPICVIGGITDHNISLLKNSGADLYAMCRGIWDPET